MKKKIGEIYNKPIIEGDINLKTPYEIHKSELVDVPMSGGSTSNVEYLDVSGAGAVESSVTTFSSFAKVSVEGMVAVAPTYVLVAEGAIGVGKFPIAVAIDFSAKVILGEPKTIKDVIISNGFTADQLAAIPRITEEEFYNLES